MCEADIDSKHDNDDDTNVGAKCLSSVNHLLPKKDIAISLSHCPRQIVPALLAESPPLSSPLIQKRARAKVAARGRLLCSRAILRQQACRTAVSEAAACQARAGAKLLRRKTAKAARRAALCVWNRQLALHAQRVNSPSFSEESVPRAGGLPRRARAQAAFLKCVHTMGAEVIAPSEPTFLW